VGSAPLFFCSAGFYLLRTDNSASLLRRGFWR